MGNHNDDTQTGSFRPDDARHVTARELGERDRRIHDLGNRFHAQATDVALLKQRVEDHRQWLEHTDKRLDKYHDECEAGVTDARKYASALVAEYKREMAETRKDEREEDDKRQNRFLVIIGLIVTAVTGIATVVAQMWLG